MRHKTRTTVDIDTNNETSTVSYSVPGRLHNLRYNSTYGVRAAAMSRASRHRDDDIVFHQLVGSDTYRYSRGSYLVPNQGLFLIIHGILQHHDTLYLY